VAREEAIEWRSPLVKRDGTKCIAPPSVARKATDYFVLALATTGTGDTERAKVWFAWGESRLLYPYTSGERRPSIPPGEPSAAAESARAEPFRLEAAASSDFRRHHSADSMSRR
jgi:hypothetical protein